MSPRGRTGRSSGTGSPLFFRCANCRKNRRPGDRRGILPRVELTGRERPFRATRMKGLGDRSTGISREYRCLDCGHVGWSSHFDLERLAQRQAAEPPTFEIPFETVYPLDEQHRYRVYARKGDELEVLCASPTPEGMGAALVQLDRDAAEHGRRLVDHGAIGVLDVLDRRWIVMPWHRPEGKTRIREIEVIL